jgi:hypothetical protein
MPYITQDQRTALENNGFFPVSTAEEMHNGGDLNYALSSLCAEFLNTRGLSYSTISDIVGALEGAKLEFVRQVVNPYEDLKILENGGLLRYQQANSQIEARKEEAINEAIDEAVEKVFAR